MNKIIKNFKNIKYGPAPEDDKEVIAWIKQLSIPNKNYIDGKWVSSKSSKKIQAINPSNKKKLFNLSVSSKKDVDLAVNAASKAHSRWSKLSPYKRSKFLYSLARLIQKHSRFLAVLETIDNGKPIRETRDIDIPLVARHFYYHAGWAAKSQANLESIGVVGQIIPWNFPILMATWKLAPALAAGNCIVLKPAEQTPVSILFVIEIIADLLPAGVLNVVNGFGPEAGKPLATHPDIKKVAFTGETTTGRLIMQYASENIIPVTLELGGKSPNIFFESVMAEDDNFLDKAIEGLVLFAFNQGEVCTCPSRALIQENIYDEFMARCLKRIEAIKMGDTLDTSIMMGAQASNDQYEKILNYIDVGKQEGAELLIGGEAYKNETYPNGFYIKPTVFKGHNKMRIFQEEIFGPVLSVTTFKDEAEAMEIANDTLYGLGAGVWTRDIHQMQTFSRGIEAGRVWCNCYHAYPAHASFGGYKKSGFGRENHKMMLNHYRHTKNVLMSYDKNPLGFF